MGKDALGKIEVSAGQIWKAIDEGGICGTGEKSYLIILKKWETESAGDDLWDIIAFQQLEGWDICDAVRMTLSRNQIIDNGELICKVNTIEPLKAKIKELRTVLIAHRADLHQGSSRPCGTCQDSAKALGIVVPGRCAQQHIDKVALKKLKNEQAD